MRVRMLNAFPRGWQIYYPCMQCHWRLRRRRSNAHFRRSSPLALQVRPIHLLRVCKCVRSEATKLPYLARRVCPRAIRISANDLLAGRLDRGLFSCGARIRLGNVFARGAIVMQTSLRPAPRPALSRSHQRRGLGRQIARGQVR
jgi:hypothetical protein